MTAATYAEPAARVLPDQTAEQAGFVFLPAGAGLFKCYNPLGNYGKGSVYLVGKVDGDTSCLCWDWLHCKTDPPFCKHSIEADRRDLFNPALVDYQPHLKPLYRVRADMAPAVPDFDEAVRVVQELCAEADFLGDA